MIAREQLIDDVFLREGDTYGDQHSSPPIDQPTGRGGIILQTLAAYKGAPATIAELKALTHLEARAIVDWKLGQIERQMGLTFIPFEPLKLQLIDFGYNSGEGLALRWLQRVLQVPRTSHMDYTTVHRLTELTEDLVLVHQALIAARLQMIDIATDPGGSVDHKYEEGLESRALTFSRLEVP